ncbi:MAG TPA: DUF58 domain-containing protein [Nevskiaceae bacterium]|nr:DUF58 domain-containing protein [Nevskiaceae bacterium]
MRIWLLLKILLHPLNWVQARIDAWVMARVKRQPGPIRVPRHRVYIVPTRFGYGFALLGLVMLLGAMNYSNSMAFALTFLIGGLGLISMHHTHGNLVNIELRAGRSRPVFAGEIAHFEILLDNPSPRARYALELAWPRQPALASGDVEPRATQSLLLSQPAPSRGWLPCRVFSVSTEFPLGLFHAWTWAELELSCLVFPRPAPAGGREPPVASGSGGLTSGHQAGHEEFAGLRDYQRGDGLRSVHWKSLPKLGSLMTKQFHESLERELWLDWDQLGHLETEARLSQLTRWVLDAEAAGRRYGLRLPGQRVAPGQGEAHQYDCLKALALHGL